MRWGVNRYTDESLLDTQKGLYTLDANATNNVLQRTEECRPGHVGDTLSGFFNYAQDTAKLVFRFADHDEEWTRQ